MKRIMFKQAIFVLPLLSSLTIAESIETKATTFTVKENYRNRNGVFYKSSQPQTMLSCGHDCLRNSRCTATNFRPDKSGDGVCELVDLSPSEMPHGLEFDEEWLFSQSMKDDCRFAACDNGGSCVYNEMSDDYQCSCPTFWTGDKCHEIKDPNAVFNFTTLGSHGRRGPSSSAGYIGTVLDTTLVINGIHTWTAPMAGKYHVTACGAAGANGTHGSKGGEGALVNGTIILERGDVLKIIVGQEGETKDGNFVGGGGGGTFVVSYAQNNYNALVVAGGGGGGGYKADGGHGRESCGGFTNGGEVCAEGGTTNSGGGGGFHRPGSCFKSSICVNEPCSSGGRAFVHGGEGGTADRSYANCDGGFGGGGACSNAPGGGGGYTGGKVTSKLFSNGTRVNFAEGGCSLAPPDGITTAGYNSGDGYVTLHLVS